MGCGQRSHQQRRHSPCLRSHKGRRLPLTPVPPLTPAGQEGPQQRPTSASPLHSYTLTQETSPFLTASCSEQPTHLHKAKRSTVAVPGAS